MTLKLIYWLVAANFLISFLFVAMSQYPLSVRKKENELSAMNRRNEQNAGSQSMERLAHLRPLLELLESRRSLAKSKLERKPRLKRLTVFMKSRNPVVVSPLEQLLELLEHYKTYASIRHKRGNT